MCELVFFMICGVFYGFINGWVYFGLVELKWMQIFVYVFWGQSLEMSQEICCYEFFLRCKKNLVKLVYVVLCDLYFGIICIVWLCCDFVFWFFCLILQQ